MSKKLIKVFSISLAVAILFTNSAFATAYKSQAALVSAEITRTTSNIKSGEGSTADVNRLVYLSKQGNVEARKAILSFDCFNENKVDAVTKNVKVEPNTEKTFTFDDGSSIVLKNVTKPADVSLMRMPAPAALQSNGFPTDPQTTWITEDHKLLGASLYTHGGTVTWYDSSRRSCHIIASSPYLSGSFLTITSASSSMVTSGDQTSSFMVTASISYTQAGVTSWSKVGSDVMYIETAGCYGFYSEWLCAPY